MQNDPSPLEVPPSQLADFVFSLYPNATLDGKRLIIDTETRAYVEGLRAGQIVRGGLIIQPIDIASEAKGTPAAGLLHVRRFLGLSPSTELDDAPVIRVLPDPEPSAGNPDDHQPRENRLSVRSSHTNNLEPAQPLPHSEEAEKAVLSAILQWPDECGPIAEKQITALYFHSPRHNLIYSTLDYCRREGTPLDFISLTQFLKDNGNLEAVGGAAYLTELLMLVPSSHMLVWHLDILAEKYALRQLLEFSREVERRAYDSQEARDIVETVSTRLENIKSTTNRTARKLSVRSFGDIFQMEFTDDLDNYFGDRILAAGQSSTLLGPGGIGKSRLALQHAVCMILGQRFLGMETHAHGKKWLFIQNENSNRRLSADIQKLAINMRLHDSEIVMLNKSLFIHTVESEDDAFLDVTQPEIAHKVNELVQDIKSDFVVWDPLNSMTTGELNGDKDMREVCVAIGKITRQGNPDRVPFILHHSITGKQGAAKAIGWDKSSYGRNSKALYAWTRSQINLAMRDPEDNTLLILSCGKNNNGRPFSEIGVKFNEEMGIYMVDPDYDPAAFREEIAGGQGGKATQFKSKWNKEMVLEEFRSLGSLKASQLQEHMREKGMSKAKFYIFWDELKEGDLITHSTSKEGAWEVSK